MLKLLWLILGLVPVWFLTKWAGHAEDKLSPLIWTGAFCLGGAAIVGCRLVEGGVAIFLTPGSLFWLGIIVPIIEEPARLLAVHVQKAHSVAMGTWVGGAMGVIETGLKILEGMSDAGQPYRLLASVPLHGFLGGILTRGSRWLPIAIGIHGAFNASFAFGYPFSWILALTVAWISGFVWLVNLDDETRSRNAAGPQPSTHV